MRSVGFIGAGNMGFALAKGLARRFPGIAIHVADRNQERVELFRRELAGVHLHPNAAGVAESADTVFLAVKPQDYAGLLPELRGTAALIISIAAGVTIARLEQALPQARVVRVMPNTPCLVGEMAAAYACGQRVSTEDRETVQELLEAAGRAVALEEPLLDAVTGLSGSGPAFVARLMEAFQEAGSRLGLPREAARELTLQTFRGTARLLQETGMEPEALVAMVSSTNGTTVAGRAVLEASDVKEVLFRTVEAAARRSRELAGS
jgi:pyrroline-5-carboxylate reductase